jgi:3',5'-cyclic AMP phosphodiesterase CpdA
MLIAQISDTHITPPGELLAGRIDSAARLREAVQTLQRFEPDCVLATGDLTDRGEPEAYAQLRALLAPLSMPVYAIPGNHDLREPMRQAFADCDWMPRTPGSRLHYEVQAGPVTVLALDTLVEREDHGELGELQAAWLEQRLQRATSRPIVIMLHHPPLNSGIVVMDSMKLRDAMRFGEIVSGHWNIERVLCGHLHRAMHVRWRNTLVSVPSSTVEQLRLDFRAEAPLATVGEPAGLQLHYWDPQDGLVTHNVPIGDYPGPFPC